MFRLWHRVTLPWLGRCLIMLLGLPACLPAHAGNPLAPLDQDPHYTSVGFFDVHVCNWPDRAPFYMVVFSTTEFERLAGVTVLDAQGQALGEMDLKRFQIRKNGESPEKRIFITYLPIPAHVRDGWLIGVMKMRDGRQYQGRDFVVHALLPIAHDLVPPPDSELREPPSELRWDSIPGSKYYKVTIRDEWENDDVIFTSPLLREPVLKLPEGLLKRGGRYHWRIHARDTDTSTVLGDFNHGSMSAPARFSISP
jgi:hypothetical protein